MAPGGAREIVDRTEIVATLENDCLLGGVSTAIVARHKMGKSFLLQHLHNRWPKLAAASDALFCHITLARLRETLGADEPLTDSVFYRYMIRELATQLQDRIMSDRQRWQLQIDSNNAQLATISADDPLRDAVSEQTSDFNAKLAGLSDLERLLVAMRIPLSRSRPVGKLDLVKILDELNELHKRVMLLVDDLHHFLEKNEFSDDLYQFVRGGDKVGNIVALFSVPVRPRDLQLHSKQLAKGREALFNHIQPKPLPPFSDTDVAAYFNHLYPDETLTAEEGRYLFELGGGSPQFLLVAYNLFVLRQHPTRVERVAFEAELAKAFQKGFQEIWAWCDDTEKAVLRNVAQFSATEDTLARQNLISSGYLIPARPTNQAKMFSNLFVDFVREQIRVRVKAELPFDVLPTALFFAQPKKAEPLVTFVLDNPTA